MLARIARIRMLGTVAPAALLLLINAAPACAQEGAEAPKPAQDERRAAEAEAALTQEDEAQEGKEKSGDIVVTGTWIRGSAPVGSQLTTIDREEILEGGRATIADTLRLQPQFSTLGATESQAATANNASSNFGMGSGINLRGLGPDSTLVLLNGERLAPAAKGTFVDLTQLPLAAVQRVEIVADGASAIYGADAIGGVVNIITRRSIDGVETSARYDVGDGIDGYTLGLATGQNWSSGSVAVTYEYYYRSALAASDRYYITSDLRAFGGPDLRTAFSDPGTLVVSGVTYAIPAGQNGRSLTASQLVAGTSNLLDYWRDADILPSHKRHSVVISGEQRLTDWLTFQADVLYAHRESTRRDFPQTVTLTVPRTNPFFVSPVASATSVTVRWSPTDEIGANTQTGPTETYAATAGLDIRLPGDWRGRVSATTSRTEYSIDRMNRINTTLALPFLASSDPNTALNVFGDGPGVNNRSTMEAIRGWFHQFDRNHVDTVRAVTNGTLLSLPAGSLKVALGAEYRTESNEFLNTSFTSGTVPAISDQGGGNRSVGSLFAEAVFPIFSEANGVPGARRLEVSGSVRYEDYSDFGPTTNPRFGVRWEPTEGLTFRASYGTSFRAPLLNELFGITYFALGNVTTPSGVRPFIIRQGSNRDLDPQTAETLSFGMDFEPTAIPGLRLNLTAFEVDYSDRIATLISSNFATAVANPQSFGSLVQLSPPLATIEQILASPLWQGPTAPANTIAGIIDARHNNTGSVKQKGIDAVLSYEREIGPGVLSTTLAGTYLSKYEVTVVQGLQSLDLLNVLGNPLGFRGRGTVGLRSGGFNAVLGVNYSDKYENRSVSPTVNVDSWTTVDLHLSMDGQALHRSLSGASLSLDVQNVFDTDPPRTPVPLSITAFDPNVGSPIGRLVSLTLTKRW